MDRIIRLPTDPGTRGDRPPGRIRTSATSLWSSGVAAKPTAAAGRRASDRRLPVGERRAPNYAATASGPVSPDCRLMLDLAVAVSRPSADGSC